ncbi:hypothetical protein TNCV_2206281 [Trichonephila clavipes]|uniref:Uncharacterized protein n=1 Tax=Trichonephila clavipes TaxID=2585209 RepID=A0A8X6V549_TRICX|nr:hypothetical protein TNCV_2206281 [Trichonephila clavipes]
MKANLIASRYECPRCKKEMRLQERKGMVDGYEWRCRSQSKDNPHDVVRITKGHTRLDVECKGQSLQDGCRLFARKFFFQTQQQGQEQAEASLKNFDACVGLFKQSEVANKVCTLINEAQENQLRIQCPLRRPDVIPYDFFLGEYVKDNVFIPPLPVDIDELKQLTGAGFDSDILTRVWVEMDYE